MAPFEVEPLEARPTLLERTPFEYPDSLDTFTPVFRTGLIPLAVFAMMSLLSVTALLTFITHRLISWRRHYRQYVGYNQYVILIYNLLLADLQQSIAFSISFHWLNTGSILAPTVPCFMQAWFLNIGDVASGFFVLAIAMHTWLGVVRGYKLPYRWFVVSILLIWLFALGLTIIGPAIYGDRFFARAGSWCWIATKFQNERLWLHYFWIFVVEFGTIAIYGHIFVHLRGRIQSIINNDTSKLSRATKFMVLYPFVYIVLTLPIAVGRMVAMTGHRMPDVFFVVAGSLLTSCGWIDALLYALTRRILVNNELSEGHYNRTAITVSNANAARPGDTEEYGLQSMANKAIATTTRSVTIVGGSDRLSRIGRGRSHTRRHQESIDEDMSTRTGSQDSMVKPPGINIVTETNIQVETASDEFEIGSARSKDLEYNKYT